MNMVGNMNVYFYMEDSSEHEMECVFDDIAYDIEGILVDYGIVSDLDFQITQESYETNNRATAAMGLEKQDGKTFKEGVKEIVGAAKEFVLGIMPKGIKS